MRALALLEFESVARGMLAVDRMLKRAPVALLRCGTIHPGRYLALVGGTVASTEEAYREGCRAGEPCDTVLLPDPHPAVAAVLAGESPSEPGDRDLLVLETGSSPTLVRLVDAVLKAVPLELAVLRLADDLGGRAFAVLAGELADLQNAAALAGADPCAPTTTLVPRPDPELRATLATTTRFGDAPARPLAGGEHVEEV